MTRLLISIVAMLLAACASSVDTPSKSSAGAAGAQSMGYHGPVHRMPGDYSN